uniref:Putative secreted protein n=1 Tax=Haematobia irritans TaxID=7368 RepID=A0A1L8EIX0_HAEIR
MFTFHLNLALYTLVMLWLGGHAISAMNIPTSAPSTAPLAALTSNTTEGEMHLRDVKTITDIRAFIAQHPNLHLTRLMKKERQNTLQTVKYTLGGRVSGDRLVAQYGDTTFYPAKKDVTTQVTYPATGTGSVVTAVEIHCLQDDNAGNAYVVAGGLGQRFISIVLEATQTERFTYNIHVYGTN